MKDRIEHKGIIESIEGNHVRVLIVQHSACSGCQAKSMCTSAESKEKHIDVMDMRAERFQIGQEVTVCGSLTMGRSAVIIAFGIPLVIIVAWLFSAMLLLGLNDLQAVGVLVLLLVAYYVGLHLMETRLSRKFLFWIE